MHAKSMSAVDSVESQRAYREWACLVRKDRPPADMKDYLQGWEGFFDHYASQVEHWHRRNAGYHRTVASMTSFYVPSGARVLEVGSGNGDLLASLKPSYGVGVDISGEMVRLAREKHPNLKFLQMPAECLHLPGEQFDFIILSDLLGYLYDLRLVFERLREVCHSRTRIVMHWYSRLWQPVFALAEKVGLKYPQPMVNWTTREDVSNLLYLAGFELVHQRGHTLLPNPMRFIGTLANRYLARLPGFRWLCLTNLIIARPVGVKCLNSERRVSVICPCRNESGNIEHIVRRLPSMGRHTELIFVEGHSTDDTLEQCQRIAAAWPNKDIQVFVQEGKGKADAVRLGFSRASGDILMILDADLSVAPEDLPQFYEALVSGRGEFLNGSRLVYAMDPQAMRFLNVVGNKVFALLLSTLLGQAIKDTLCGTKVMFRTDYQRIAAGRAYFGDFDPFGDFDLLFGAAKLNLRIVEIPVRYRERMYGTTNISRFTHGWLLLKMSFRAATKLFFIP